MRKTILILGHNYATQFIDIYNQYTRLFDPDKYEVTVAYLTGEPDETVKQRTLAENVLFLDIPKKDIRALKINAIRKLLKLTREKQFQIVICHRYKPIYIMMWVAQFQPIPALFFVLHELRTMTSIARQLIIAGLARKNMYFAGVSNSVRDDIRKSLWCVPNERIITLYNMIDVDLTEPALLSRTEAREALHLPQDAFVFGNIARLAPNKDQKNLIHSFSLIKNYCPNAKLIILGDGDLEAILKQQVTDLGLQQDVIFAGYVARGFRYMQAFDCFVLNSIQEAFGRVLLEAMVAKVPVIATEVHGIPEVVGDTSVLIPARDAAALSQAMQKIYKASEKEHSEQATKAYQHVLANYSIPAFKEQFWQNPLVKFLKE